MKHDRILPSLNRRTVLASAGSGLLASFLSGTAAASSANATASEPTSQPLSDIQSEVTVATDVDSGEEFAFETTDKAVLSDLPAGTYEVTTVHTDANGQTGQTEIIELDGAELTSADEPRTLSVDANTDRGVAPGGTVQIWASTVVGEEPMVDPIPDAELTVRLEDPDSEVVTTDTIVTNENGLATDEVSIPDDSQEGFYDIAVEWEEEGTTSFLGFSVGPLVELAFPPEPATPGEPTAFALSRTEEYKPAPGSLDVELEDPDGNVETVSTTVSDGGVGLVEFTPDQQGEYELYRPGDSFGRSMRVQNLRFLTSGFRIRDQLVDEPITFGGFVLDEDIQRAGNQTIDVELHEGFSPDEPLQTIESTTDPNGRFVVEFDSQSETGSYTAVVRSASGTIVAEERIQLSEIEDDSPTPSVSVSIDQSRLAPAETVTTQIEVEDADGEPIANTDIAINERVRRGAYLDFATVTTDADGNAEYETTAPENFIEGERLEIEAVAELSDDVISGDDSSTVQTINVNRPSTGQLGANTPGEPFQADIEVTEQATDDPVADYDVGVLLGYSDGIQGGYFGSGSGSTNSDGIATVDLEIPENVRYGYRFNVLARPTNQISRRGPVTFDQAHVSVNVPDEVTPGESFEMDYTVEESQTGAAGVFFIDSTWDAQIKVAEPDEPFSVDVPVSSAGGSLRIDAIVIDSDGNFSEGFSFVSVADNGATPEPEPNAEFSVTPTAPAVGESVEFDASSSSVTNGTIESYEWDFTENGETDAEGQTATYTFEETGVVSVGLTVTTEDGTSDSTTQDITIIAEDAHESGVSQDLFDAVDGDNSGDLNRTEVRDLIDKYAQEGEIEGIPVDRDNVRKLIRYYAQQ